MRVVLVKLSKLVKRILRVVLMNAKLLARSMLSSGVDKLLQLCCTSFLSGPIGQGSLESYVIQDDSVHVYFCETDLPAYSLHSLLGYRIF